MSTLYETNKDKCGCPVYTSLNGYTMQREENEDNTAAPWVLRDPNGEFVGSHDFRSILAKYNGFELLEQR